MIWFYRTIAFLSHLIPYRIAVFITERIADGAYFTFYRKARYIVFENLNRYNSKLKIWQKKELTLKIFRNFAVFIYEFTLLPQPAAKRLFDRLTIENRERLDNALREGNGAIVLTAHLGNWELGAAALNICGYPPVVVALPHQSKKITEFFTRRRKACGMDVVYLGEGMKKVVTALKQNRVIATLGDRDYLRHGILCPFMGGKISFPIGIFELANRTASPIIPAFCVKEKGTYRISFEPPIRVNNVEDSVKEWSRILERYVRTYITQWFVFDLVFDH